MHAQSFTRKVLLGFAMLAAAGLVSATFAPSPADAAKRGKKIRVCVDKKGRDKGQMRLVKRGKCKRGERKLTWNKRGKRGKPGPAGAAGAQGPAGPPGNAAALGDVLERLDALESEVNGLSTALDALTAQVGDLDRALSDGLEDLQAQIDAAAVNIGELCGQVASLTGANDAVVGAVNTIAALPILGLALEPLDVLGEFSCSTS